MSAALFAYGTLMFPEVFEAVTGRRGRARAAWLPGFRRRSLAAALYPGIVLAPDEGVKGVVWEGLDDPELARVDAFETDVYRRESHTVQRMPDASTAAPGDARMAWVYVIPREHSRLLSAEPWDPAVFAERHLTAFLAGLGGG